MSNQGSYYDQGQNQNYQSQNPYQQDQPPAHNFNSNNPWADQSGNPPSQHQQYEQQQQQSYGGYQAPPGPPPSQQQYSGFASPTGAPPGQAPKRSETFREADFVPEAERGEQREAMQQFEMNQAGRGTQSQTDRDVEALEREFPSIDSSLIAALYSDAGSLGATREMLVELDGK